MIRRNTKLAEVQPGEIPDSNQVLAELALILATPLFQNSKRYPAFLRHVVEQTLAGAKHELKERTLGITVFRRPPDYDTSADPVVRNTASEVRKRLEEYYSDAAHGSETIISLPAGTYVPEFRLRAPKVAPPEEEPAPLAPAPVTPAPVTDAVPMGAQTPSRKWPVWAIAISLVAVAVMGATELFPRKSATKMFWGPFLETADPILVVADTWMGIAESYGPTTAGSQSVRQLMDPRVFLDVSEQSAKLGAFLGSQGKRMNHELARNVTLGMLRPRPFILRGAFNNSWTLRAVSPFRFYFRLDENPLVRRIVDRQNPDRLDWAAPMSGVINEDYALIVRAPEQDTGQMMLVIAGLGTKGSAAALEFVTNPKYMDRFNAQAPAGWEWRNLEVVIKTNLVNDDWGEPRVVSTHFW